MGRPPRETTTGSSGITTTEVTPAALLRPFV